MRHAAMAGCEDLMPLPPKLPITQNQSATRSGPAANSAWSGANSARIASYSASLRSKKLAARLRPVCNPFRCQYVNVAQFVFRGLEIGKLDVPLVDVTQKLTAPRLTPSSPAISRCDASGLLSRRHVTRKCTSSRCWAILSLDIELALPVLAKATAQHDPPSEISTSYEPAGASRS